MSQAIIITLSGDGDPRRLVDEDISLFEAEMVASTGTDKLTKYERAILKTYLLKKLDLLPGKK